MFKSLNSSVWFMCGLLWALPEWCTVYTPKNSHFTTWCCYFRHNFKYMTTPSDFITGRRQCDLSCCAGAFRYIHWYSLKLKNRAVSVVVFVVNQLFYNNDLADRIGYFYGCRLNNFDWWIWKVWFPCCSRRQLLFLWWWWCWWLWWWWCCYHTDYRYWYYRHRRLHRLLPPPPPPLLLLTPSCIIIIIMIIIPFISSI